MTETAARDNAGKVELSEIWWFEEALQALANHMAAGRAKYPDTPEGIPNFVLGGKPDSEYLNAAQRHLARIVQGEWYDDELGTPHAAACIWNLAALISLNHPHELRRAYSGPEQPGPPARRRKTMLGEYRSL